MKLKVLKKLIRGGFSFLLVFTLSLIGIMPAYAYSGLNLSTEAEQVSNAALLRGLSASELSGLEIPSERLIAALQSNKLPKQAAAFRAITFPGQRTAAKAFDAIASTHNYNWIDNVAILSRSQNGFIRVDSTWAQSDTALGASINYGALTGALIGALMGPQGAIAGAIGAGAIGGTSLGAWVGAMTNLAFGDPRLEQFARQLDNDTSALILVSEPVSADEFDAAFSSLGGKLTATELDEKDIEALTKLLKAAR